MTKLERYMSDKNWTESELAGKLGCKTDSVGRFIRVGLTKHNRTVHYARALGCRVIDIKE